VRRLGSGAIGFAEGTWWAAFEPPTTPV